MSFSSRGGQGSIGLFYLFIIVVGLFLFGFVALFSHQLLNDLNADIQADNDVSDTAKATAQSVTTNFPLWMDGGFVFLIVLLWILLLVASWNFESHPALFIILVIVLAFLVFAASIFAETYGDFVSDSDYSSFAGSFPMTDFFISHMIIFLVTMGASMMIVLYSNRS